MLICGVLMGVHSFLRCVIGHMGEKGRGGEEREGREREKGERERREREREGGE